MPATCSNRKQVVAISARIWPHCAAYLCIVRRVEQELGARIRELREASSILAGELAEQIGIDATAMSKIENGRRGVKSAELARIARALRVSPLALLEPQSLVGRMPIAARTAGATVRMGEAYDRLVSLAELHEVLAEDHIFSSPKLSGIPSVAGMPWLEAAERLADWARGTLPIDVDGDERFEELAKQIQAELGIDVLVEPYPGDPLSGAAITDRSFPLIFVNAAHALPRSLFTLAHELGHVLAGHDGGGITLDRELSGSTDDERLANAFAASFLMPKERVLEVLDEMGRSDAALIRLTFEFGVSFESLIYRLHNLGVINAEGRDSLRQVNWRQIVLHLSDESSRANLTFADAGRLQARSVTPPPMIHPALLVARATAGFRKGSISAHALAGLVGADFETLLGDYEDDPDLARARELIDADYQPKLVEQDEDRFSGQPI